MTNIDELEGRELDAAVGVALGWRRRNEGSDMLWLAPGDDERNGSRLRDDPDGLPHYHDWEWPAVLDAMEDMGWFYNIGVEHNGYYAEFWNEDDSIELGVGSTRAEAVCRAALRAMAAAP